MNRDSKNYTVLSAKAATGIDKILDVRDFRHVILSFSTASSANLTAKVQGSIQVDTPDFTAAQSPSNQWDYVQMKDLEDGSTVDGDTGFAVAGTDDQKQYEVNVNGLNYITVNVTARSAGSVTVLAALYNE